MNKVLTVIDRADMRLGHEGLTELAKGLGVDVSKLKVGEFVMFINASFTAVKMFAANNVVCHYKHPKGHILNYEALKLIPAFYDGQDLGYEKALKKVILDKYPTLRDRLDRERAKEAPVEVKASQFHKKAEDNVRKTAKKRQADAWNPTLDAKDAQAFTRRSREKQSHAYAS